MRKICFAEAMGGRFRPAQSNFITNPDDEEASTAINFARPPANWLVGLSRGAAREPGAAGYGVSARVMRKWPHNSGTRT